MSQTGTKEGEREMSLDGARALRGKEQARAKVTGSGLPTDELIRFCLSFGVFFRYVVHIN
jgi:hypothetical protein